MTTTDCQVIIECSDGSLYHGYKETTDTTEAECQIRDYAGGLTSVGEAILGKTITRLACQCSDGSILTQFNVYVNGAVVWGFYGGERLAASEDVYNMDARGLAIPVDKTLKIKILTAD